MATAIIHNVATEKENEAQFDEMVIVDNQYLNFYFNNCYANTIRIQFINISID